MNAPFAYPRLVRVVWKNRTTRQVRHFVAANVAQDVEHARDIGEAILMAMVPCSQPLNIAMQTALIGRNATAQDMHSHETPWETFYSERMNYTPPPKRKSKGLKR